MHAPLYGGGDYRSILSAGSADVDVPCISGGWEQELPHFPNLGKQLPFLIPIVSAYLTTNDLQ